MKAKKVKIKNIIIFLVLMIMLNFESIFSLSKWWRVRLGVYSIVALYRDIDEVVTVQVDSLKQNELQFIFVVLHFFNWLWSKKQKIMCSFLLLFEKVDV
jgi:hypothetical protein